MQTFNNIRKIELVVEEDLLIIFEKGQNEGQTFPTNNGVILSPSKEKNNRKLTIKIGAMANYTSHHEFKKDTVEVDFSYPSDTNHLTITCSEKEQKNGSDKKEIHLKIEVNGFSINIKSNNNNIIIRK